MTYLRLIRHIDRGALVYLDEVHFETRGMFADRLLVCFQKLKRRATTL